MSVLPQTSSVLNFCVLVISLRAYFRLRIRCALPFTGSAHLVKATEVAAGLAESNGSLLPGLWSDSLHVTCGLMPVHRDQLRAQRSVTSMGKLYRFYLTSVSSHRFTISSAPTLSTSSILYKCHQHYCTSTLAGFSRAVFFDTSSRRLRLCFISH